MLQPLTPDVLERRNGDCHRVPRQSTTPRSRGLDAARSAAHLVGASTAIADGQADRLLLRRVRAAPVAADLRRRPRRAGRRSLQGSERPRRAARSASASCIRRATSTSACRRTAGSRRVYERLNWADAPIEPAADARRQAVRHRRAARRPHRAGGGLARARSAACSCTCSTPTSKRTRRGIASCRRGSTAATARRASSRRSSSASAACAR